MVNPVIRKLVEKVPYTLLEGAVPNRADVPMAPFGPATQQVGPLVKKKRPGFRQWLRFDSSGAMEFLELDRNAIIERLSIPARDLRILGPVFSQSSHILARERAMIVNLEFIRAIVTAEEVFILEASDPADPFVNQLKEHLSSRYHSASPGGYNQLQLVDVDGGAYNGSGEMGVLVPRSSPGNGNDEENPDQLPDQLPFEFGVLEVAIDVVCQFLDRSVRDLELKANHTLDEFTRNITWSNIELVRSLKSDLTQLTGRVQKVRDELEQLLDDDKDMADLYLTRKLAYSQHLDSASASFREDGYSKVSHFHDTASLASSVSLGNEDVEELEMLLEAYFMQLDGTLNRLTMIREHIDDTEDYINIQLDHQRNQLFQLQITLSTGALAVAIATALCSACSMNIQWVYIYDPANNVFAPYLTFTLLLSVTVFFSILGYVYWTGLFER